MALPENNPQNAPAKKTYQQPHFWILDSSIEGGAGANVNEATARTTGVGFPAHAGQPSRPVYKAGHYGSPHSANWTAAHS